MRPRHAYSVLDVRDAPGSLRLLQLRNPWGHYSWRGAYSHSCPRWTEPLRRALHVTRETDDDQGVFWISFDDVLKLEYLKNTYDMFI